MIADVRTDRRDDRGFTLIEVLIVVVTMGLIVTSLSLIVTTVLRTAPGSDARDDDSRTLLGLTTYMPEDVNSTPPGGFDIAKTTATGCSGASPGVNLVRMTWTEIKSTTETFRAAFRYVDTGSGYRIVRYTCRDGQAPLVTSMTSKLPAINEATWTPGSAPVAVAIQQVAGEDVGLKVTVTTVAGDQIYLEMFSNNPDETLPLLPPGFYPVIPPGNQAPTAADVSVTTTALVPVNIGLPAADPDGDGVTITLLNVPALWTASVSGLTLTVTPPLLALPGATASFEYRVSDPYGQTAEADVDVLIIALGTNQPPTASNYTGTIVAGSPTIINLPASDPDSDPLSTTVTSGHPSLTVAVTGPTQLTITSDGSQVNPGPFNYTVSDKTLTASAEVNVNVTTCNVTNLSPASTTVQRKTNGKLKNSVTYTVSYTGPCSNLVLEYRSDEAAASQTAFLSFGAGNSVTIQGNPGGHNNWTVGDHQIRLRDSQTGPVLRSAVLKVTL